jgi:hypothetical protein
MEVRAAIEIIIAWGLYPSLKPGVGVPLSKRSKSRKGVLALYRHKE